MRRLSLKSFSWAFLLGIVLGLHPAKLAALSLDAPVFLPGDASKFSVDLYRYEKPSSWWVNQGLPETFFMPVSQLSLTPKVYQLHGVEYGIGATGWFLDRFQARFHLPFETNVYTSPDLSSHHSARPGDLEAGLSILGVGRRDSRFRAALDGLVRFPTGRSPFRAVSPLLATGTGFFRATLGAWGSERVGRFSFFQWINYQNSGTVHLDQWAGLPAPGASFQWPDEWNAGLQAAWRVFKRGSREVTLSYEFRARQSGHSYLDGQLAVPGGRIFSSIGTFRVRADEQMALEGQVTVFPVDFHRVAYYPDSGVLLTVALHYYPWG